MRYLTWFLRIVLFVALLGFALKNNEPVVLRYFFGYEWNTTLVVALLSFFALGMLFGVVAMVQPWFRLRGELAEAKRALQTAQQQPATPSSPEQVF
ncbi:MAG: LapA family protein [Sideroxyarcus sp.]|nr:LapA family protein [Sideroxyarcus sp.]